ncbi:MAG: hypothetical protein KBS96_00110 [Lachnospiraceae bacterium]|nr:hypothetical protein [Candidatus Colinaster scatohippi]
MITFRDNLYLSPSIKKADKIKWKIKTGRGQFNVYLIAYNHDSRKLEFFHNGLLKQKALYNRDIDVVGLATSDDECIDITGKILLETYEKTGVYDISGYLE